ncbi:MAG: limonene-1,2-epoxide hydrolase family protein [Byssovorax sp.]
MTEIETVQGLLAALAASDLERALTLVGDDLIYQNRPLPESRGKRAFERQMRAFFRYADRFEVETHSIAADGATVLTERTDAFVVRGARVSFWVYGTFEVRDGRVEVWRDAFDWMTLLARIGGALPRILIGSAS